MTRYEIKHFMHVRKQIIKDLDEDDYFKVEAFKV